MRILVFGGTGKVGRPLVAALAEKGVDVRREVASAIVRNGWGLLELRPMRLSLEEVFLSLTTEDVSALSSEAAETGEARKAEEIAQ